MLTKLTVASSLIAIAFSNPLDSTVSRRDENALLLDLPTDSFAGAIEAASVNKAGDVFAASFVKGNQIELGFAFGFFNQVKDGTKNVLSDDNPVFVVKNDTGTAPILTGARFVHDGNRLLLADAGNHRVLSVDVATSRASIFCSDRKMLQPNDIAISAVRDCLIYLSGQNYTANTVAGESGDLWTCDGGRAAQFDPEILKKAGIHRTNGVEASPDGSFLYLTSAENVDNNVRNHKIFKFALDTSTGALLKRDPELFYEFTGLEAGSDLDGMRTDVDGNLYATLNGEGKIIKLSPEGKVLQTILTTGVKGPSNVELGGNDGKTLFAIGKCADNAEVDCAASLQVDKAGRAFTELNKA
ncbi:hypothetical protein AJ78_08508 [Emergomyces pasteurianus Ep9510]|uniref:SMP-30/Gluconolactonase/LRE-like region domain-containing protein n=1 Tax=Emergomyces pasteurianus Ep9510 TaxID=1447872 RepID=A0A1J9Q5S7_9EURO|nr:hypothetical protein AJ78_08508 [Emergomyces pasteurianus Ep9510]